MKPINLIIYQLAVSCGVGQGFSPISWTLTVTEWRSNVVVCCYLITALMTNSKSWCATADGWSGFYSSCQFFYTDKDELLLKKQSVVLRVSCFMVWIEALLLFVFNALQQLMIWMTFFYLKHILNTSRNMCKCPIDVDVFSPCRLLPRTTACWS